MKRRSLTKAERRANGRTPGGSASNKANGGATSTPPETEDWQRARVKVIRAKRKFAFLETTEGRRLVYLTFRTLEECLPEHRLRANEILYVETYENEQGLVAIDVVKR